MAIHITTMLPIQRRLLDLAAQVEIVFVFIYPLTQLLPRMENRLMRDFDCGASTVAVGNQQTGVAAGISDD